MRVQNENKVNSSKHSEISTNDQEEENEDMTSTQNMIKDARARRQNLSKRIQCNKCEKKFNKESTFKNHMKTIHREEISTSQNSNQSKMTLPTNERRLRSYKKISSA